MTTILDALRRPFHPSQVTWKPGAVAKSGTKALAMAYGDLRAYQNRLDEVCGLDWSVTYTGWGDRIICHLTINGVTRSSTGEPDSQSERSEIAGTASEAQAFKRACAMFGLGRYLYTLPSVWAEYDKERRQFTDAAKAKLTGILTTHYRRYMAGQADADLSDAPEISQDGPTATQSAQTPQHTTPDAKTPQKPATPATEGAGDDGTPAHQRFFGVGLSVFGPDWNAGARAWLIEKWSAKVTPKRIRTSSTQLSNDEKDLLADYMNEHVSELQRVWKNVKPNRVMREAA